MIGKVPDGWRVKKLDNICQFINGYAFKSSDFKNSGVPIVRIGNLLNDKVSLDNVICYEESDKLEAYTILKDDILIAMSGATTGKMAFCDLDKKLYLNQRIGAIRTNKTILSSKYLFNFLLGKKSYLLSLAGGSAQPNLSSSDIKKLDIPIPPLPQQEKIVKVLDISSALIEKQKELIQKYDLFLKSKFIEMFGDPISNPMGWEVEKFEDILILQRGYDLPTDNRNQNGAIKVFGSNGVLGYHNEAKVKSGGVITGRSGTLGKVHYTFEDYWPLNTTLFSKDLKGNNIIFLAYFLEMFKVDRFTQGAGVPTLNRNLVHKEKTYRIPVELQKKFASIVEKTEQIKEQETKKLQHLRVLHNSLMDKAFKGEIE